MCSDYGVPWWNHFREEDNRSAALRVRCASDPHRPCSPCFDPLLSGTTVTMKNVRIIVAARTQGMEASEKSL